MKQALELMLERMALADDAAPAAADDDMRFDAADLDRPIASVFARRRRAGREELRCDSSDAAKAAFARCQARNAVAHGHGHGHEHGPHETLRDFLEWYRAKAIRCAPGEPAPPEIPTAGGGHDLVAFLCLFTVDQMLACGW